MYTSTQTHTHTQTGLLSSRSRSQQRLIWSKVSCFFYISETAGSFATKLGLILQHHKLECPVKKIGLLHSKLQQSFKMSTTQPLVSGLGMVMQHHKTECRSEKNCVLSSMSRSQQGLIWSKYDSFYYIIWTPDSLATKLGLMVHHHKPECLVGKKMDYCIQGQGQSRGSNTTLTRFVAKHSKIAPHCVPNDTVS